MKSEKGAKQKFVQTCPPTSQNENGLHYCRNTLEKATKSNMFKEQTEPALTTLSLR